MSERHHVKFIHEGNYVAEVEVNILETGDGWSPYLSLDDAQKLDDIRESLREKNISRASKLAKIYTLEPVAV